MKKAFKTPSTYIFLAVFVLVGLGVSLIPLYAAILGWFNFDYTDFVWNPDWCALGFAAVYFLIGFVLQDMIKVGNRRKTKNWSGEIPENVKDKAWSYAMPFMLAALAMLIVALVMLLICVINGKDTIREIIVGL